MTTSELNQYLETMFGHLTATYSVEEACDILNHKYPEAKEAIASIAERSMNPQVTESEKLLKAIKTKSSKQAPSKGPSKMDRARELYEAASDKSRKSMIALFGSELGLSKAAASTYFYSIK